LVASLNRQVADFKERKDKPEIDKYYWVKLNYADSKCMVSCGNTPLQVVKQYIQDQSSQKMGKGGNEPPLISIPPHGRMGIPKLKDNGRASLSPDGYKNTSYWRAKPALNNAQVEHHKRSGGSNPIGIASANSSLSLWTGVRQWGVYMI